MASESQLFHLVTINFSKRLNELGLRNLGKYLFKDAKWTTELYGETQWRLGANIEWLCEKPDQKTYSEKGMHIITSGTFGRSNPSVENISFHLFYPESSFSGTYSGLRLNVGAVKRVSDLRDEQVSFIRDLKEKIESYKK